MTVRVERAMYAGIDGFLALLLGLLLIGSLAFDRPCAPPRLSVDDRPCARSEAELLAIGDWIERHRTLTEPVPEHNYRGTIGARRYLWWLPTNLVLPLQGKRDSHLRFSCGRDHERRPGSGARSPEACL